MSTEAPEKPTGSTPDIAARRKRAHRAIGSLLAASLTVGVGALAYNEAKGGERSDSSHSRVTPPATPKTPTSQASPSEKPTENVIKTIEQLPGYGKKVSEQERQMMRASSVEIATSQKDTDDPYTTVNFCTGLKVNIGGKNYVATARHCFVSRAEEGFEFPGSNGAGDKANNPVLHRAKDLTSDIKAAGKAVSVYTLDAHGDSDPNSAVSPTRIVGSYYPDLALLSIDETASGAVKFNKLPALDYEGLLASNAEPGAQAVLYSTPISAGPRLIETEGTYLGTAFDGIDEARQLAWVAVSGMDAGKDGCNLGGSGSAANIAEAGITSSLSIMNNPAYVDKPADKRDQATQRANVLQQLGVEVGSDMTLCGFSVATPDIASNMAQVATAG